jgi:uncharacterized RDD family membrane protein YckC
MSQTPPPLPPVNPYAAPTARVTDVVVEEHTLADRGTRFAAAFVDGVLYGGVAILMAMVLPMLVRNKVGSAMTIGAVSLVFFGVFLAIIIVNCVLLHRYGQTIAKRLFKIKIVRSDGSPCGLARVIFLRALPMMLVSAAINFVVPLGGNLVSILDPLLIFRQDYRCLHDHIADTIVVKA